MAVWDYRRLHESLSKGEKRPLYVFFGDEPFLIQESLRDLVDHLLGASLRDFNLDVFYAGDVEVERVRDVVDTLPMMAERRVVVVREAQLLKAKELEGLLSLIENPVESCSLIFVFSDFDQRLKFSKLALKNGTVVKFERPAEREVQSWITKLAKGLGKKIETRASERLYERVGASLIDLHQEIRKLSQYVGDRDTIQEADVEAVVSSLRADTVFQLADAIGDSDRSSALVSLANLLDHGENPIGITSLIGRHIRILTAVREGLDRGMTASQLSQKVGVPPFFVSKYIEQSRRWTPPRLKRAQYVLLQTDRGLKSSSVAPHLWLENFVVKACSGSATEIPGHP